MQANAELGAVLPVGWDAVHRYLTGLGERLLAEGSATVLDDAPEQDRACMADPGWRARERAYRAEALKQGVDGWTDETLAIAGPWDFDISRVVAQVGWWHSADDATVSQSAARRLTDQLVNCQLHVLAGRAHLLESGPLLAELAVP